MTTIVDETDSMINTNMGFAILVGKNSGTVASATRSFLEESLSSYFLPYACNRVLEKKTRNSSGVELVYGEGYKTLVRRNNTNEVKSIKRVAVHLRIGTTANSDVSTMPVLSPTEDLYGHVSHLRGQKNLASETIVLYICTGDPIFTFGLNPENESCIALETGSKIGYFSKVYFDGTRLDLPKDLPPVTAFKRRKIIPTDVLSSLSTKKENRRKISSTKTKSVSKSSSFSESKTNEKRKMKGTSTPKNSSKASKHSSSSRKKDETPSSSRKSLTQNRSRAGSISNHKTPSRRKMDTATSKSRKHMKTPSNSDKKKRKHSSNGSSSKKPKKRKTDTSISPSL